MCTRPPDSFRALGVVLVALAPVVAVLGLALAPGAPAQAAASDSYLVTFVARQCPTYQDITANLARNNIQESLQDLGAGHRVHRRPAHLPVGRDAQPAELHRPDRVAVHLRRRHQRHDPGTPTSRGSRTR